MSNEHCKHITQHQWEEVKQKDDVSILYIIHSRSHKNKEKQLYVNTIDLFTRKAENLWLHAEMVESITVEGKMTNHPEASFIAQCKEERLLFSFSLSLSFFLMIQFHRFRDFPPSFFYLHPGFTYIITMVQAFNSHKSIILLFNCILTL